METFVIRLWTDPAEIDDSGSPPFRGAVRQVGTGATVRFHDQDELIEFLASWSARVSGSEEAGSAAGI